MVHYGPISRVGHVFEEFVGSKLHRKRYWARSLRGWRFFDAAEPNAAHRALAQLGFRVVTQNVDGLHQRGGSTEVTELHGRNDEVQCLSCGALRRRASYQEELEQVRTGLARPGLAR